MRRATVAPLGTVLLRRRESIVEVRSPKRATAWLFMLGMELLDLALRSPARAPTTSWSSASPLPPRICTAFSARSGRWASKQARCSIPRAWIEVDGGQNGENAGHAIAAGADAIVAGSAIFGARRLCAGDRGIAAPWQLASPCSTMRKRSPAMPPPGWRKSSTPTLRARVPCACPAARRLASSTKHW